MNEQNPEPADLNIDRLLSEAYQPEAIDVEFARKTVAYLEKLAAERRALPSPWRYVAWLYLANAMAILLLIVMPPLFWHYFIEEPRRQEEERKRKEKQPIPPTDRPTPRPRTQLPLRKPAGFKPVEAGFLVQLAVHVESGHRGSACRGSADERLLIFRPAKMLFPDLGARVEKCDDCVCAWVDTRRLI
jgi:hypothetical protein